MKDFILKLFIIFLGLGLFLRFMGNIPLSINTKNLDKDSTFFVSGEGESYVSPDIAKVTASVESTNSTASSAQKDMNQTINKISEELQKLGVKKEELKTVNYNIYPIYTNDGRTIASYRSVASLEVKTKDLDKINNIIDTAVGNGANFVSGVSFEVEDREQAVDEARAMAIKEAKTKAEKIASEAGIRLGKIINVTEFYPTDFQPYLSAQGLGGKDALNESTQIEPGQTQIKVTVTLSYETL